MGFNLNIRRTLEVANGQVHTANSRARAYGLADELTIDQWLTILNWWEWKCAVCDTASKDLSPDHWIPLSAVECPGTTFDNIVPLCEGCNLSKNRTEPRHWLEKRYTPEIVIEKLARVRQALQELMIPDRPYNTNIPEGCLLDDRSDRTEDSQEYRSVKLIFDMSIPGDRDMWTKIDKLIENGMFQYFVKNLLFVSLFRANSLLYEAIKPGETIT